MAGRAQVVKVLRRLFGQVREGRYKVARGQINWTKWDFAAYPFGLSITIPEEDDSQAAVEATFNFQVLTTMPHPLVLTDDQESTLEQIRDDLLFVLGQLEQEPHPDSPNDHLILGLTRLPSIEIADSDRELMGISIAAIMEY